MKPIEINKEQLSLHGLGIFDFEWMTRGFLVGGVGDQPEQKHNLIMHFFKIPKDEDFLAVLREAWERSALSDQGHGLERSYTEEFDAYDAIIYDVDPCFADSFKNLFLDALRTVYALRHAERNMEVPEEEEEEEEKEDD